MTELDIKVRQHVGWDLYVNGTLYIKEASYAVVDGVRCALRGAQWPVGELQEVAAMIRLTEKDRAEAKQAISRDGEAGS